MKVAFSPAFERSFRKRLKHNSKIQNKFWKKLECFIQDPFDPQLKTHKLTGQLKELWSFSIELDIRVVFYFVDEFSVVLVDIGSHDEVY
ncbi:plasmid stabilization protein [Achromatium sp. WMS3]|nr:plasmid stabilization protein [Achromatium sp. WMS3]